MNWRPIETAPKDATEVILGGPGWSASCRYINGRRRCGWFEMQDDFDVCEPIDDMDITHWQPLPEPPEEEE